MERKSKPHPASAPPGAVEAGHAMVRYPWHTAVWQAVAEAQTRRRLPHALLLVGPEGMGKLAFAQRLAWSLLCAQPDGHGDACGQCKECRLLTAGSHPDWVTLLPEESGKQIKVDAVRQLANFVHMTPAYQRHRVVLIAPAENMNLNAANSLLKMLEEPPPSGIFLLVSHQPARLAATIRSRCQRLDFSRPPQQAMLQWLHSREPAGADWPLLLELSHGAPLQALHLAANLDARQNFMTSLARLVLHRADPLAEAGQWTGEPALVVLDWMMQATMDMIRDRSGIHVLRNRDAQDNLRECGRRLDLPALFSLLDKQMDHARLLAGPYNLKPLGLLEDLAISWTQAVARRG